MWRGEEAGEYFKGEGGWGVFQMGRGGGFLKGRGGGGLSDWMRGWDGFFSFGEFGVLDGFFFLGVRGWDGFFFLVVRGLGWCFLLGSSGFGGTISFSADKECVRGAFLSSTGEWSRSLFEGIRCWELMAFGNW